MDRHLRAAALLGGLLAACAPRPLTPAASDPRPLGPEWSAPLRRDHPLTGRILDVRARRWVVREALDAALARADLVVLGETHDNPDHHLLQARAVRAVAASGRRPALAFEMFDAPAQERLDAAQAGGGVTADQVAEAMAWAKTGWPPFPLYRPVVEAGLAAGLPLAAANLSRATARELMKKGAEVLPPDVRAWLDRAPPLGAGELEQLRRQMAEDHCGELPEALVRPLVQAQRARDAQLAQRTAAAATPGGAILIAGNGHARRDRGVPAWLAREVPGRTLLAVAHLEVDGEKRNPDDYADGPGAPLPYDFVLFTPAAEREDPCERLKRQLEEKRAAGKPAGS